MTKSHTLYFFWAYFKASVYVSSLFVALEEHKIWITEFFAKTDLLIHKAWQDIADWLEIT
jgi:hypothetical protein